MAHGFRRSKERRWQQLIGREICSYLKADERVHKFVPTIRNAGTQIPQKKFHVPYKPRIQSLVGPGHDAATKRSIIHPAPQCSQAIAG